VKLIRKLDQTLPPLALTIGNFDGVHCGHVNIISTVKKIAKEKNLAATILTFEPHPISFLNPAKPRDFRLTSLSQKLRIFRDLGVDYVIALPFNQKFSEISAPDFAQKILREALNARHLTIGYDFTFGKNREGNFKLLEEMDFDLTEISPLKCEQHTHSSSLARRLIGEGNIPSANKIIGRNFVIEGVVIAGKKLATTLGFPTANLMAKPHIIKPKFGVYKTQTFIPHLEKTFPSITNFGIKPTITDSCLPTFETHILNLSENLYGKKICVEFLDFIREEKKFVSLEELKMQIVRDVGLVVS